jgi:hypothetical protein
VEPRGHFHQLGERSRFHLLHHLASVCLHRDFADAELPTDLFIQKARDHQCHYLPFPACKLSVTVPERPHLRLATKGCATAFEGLPDGVHQHCITEWFCEEFDSAGFHGLDGHLHINDARDEDDRHVRPFDGDELLQIETIEAWQRNVKYQTAGNKGPRASEEFLCGSESGRLPALATNHNFQRLAHGCVVVDNEHNRCAL